MGVKLTKEDVLARFKKVHGDKYDYSLVEYSDQVTPVTIICPIHGSFKQSPENHWNGHGCKKCKNTKLSQDRIISQSEFIRRAKEIHGNYYSYEKTIYTGYDNYVTITCPKHGDVQQFAGAHLRGHGCVFCANRAPLTKDIFVKMARIIHGDKYDYSKVNYINARTHVTIICPIHGAFKQTPDNHFRGNGCMQCSGKAKKTTEQFIAEAKAVHGDEYDYSSVEYINASTKVEIKCRKHGIFMQNPDSHLRGSGCPTCRASKGEKAIVDYLIQKNINFIRQYKIKLTPLLFSRNNLRVDFYLPTYNMVIEFNGVQHYKWVKNWNLTKNNFGEQQERDRRLREYCHDNGINLIEIPYTKINDIPQILSKALNIH